MTTLTFKVSEAEARAIRAAARNRNLTLSEYLRKAAKPSSGRGKKPKFRIIKHPISGLPCIESSDPVYVTQEQIKQELANFP